LRGRYPGPLLVDQGAQDQFLDRLQPEALAAAAAARRQPMEFRMLAGYDHSYFYVASVMEDHLRWHAARL
jgi:S-formylglutathione hydrolase